MRGITHACRSCVLLYAARYGSLRVEAQGFASLRRLQTQLLATSGDIANDKNLST